MTDCLFFQDTEVSLTVWFDSRVYFKAMFMPKQGRLFLVVDLLLGPETGIEGRESLLKITWMEGGLKVETECTRWVKRAKQKAEPIANIFLENSGEIVS